MRLFISFASVDRYAVRELIKVFDSADHKAWYDLWLLPGQDWRQQTLSAIEQSEAIIFVLTPESVESERCQWELATANEQGKTVIPVLFHAKTRMPDALIDHQCVDFTEGPTPAAVAQLMARLYRAEATDVAENEAQERTVAGNLPMSASGTFSFEKHVLTVSVVAIVILILFGILTNRGAVRSVFPTAFTLGPFGVAMAATVIFTAIRRSVVSLTILAAFEVLFFASYLSSQGYLFFDYCAVAIPFFLGYLLGRMRLLMWPWLSLRVGQQHNRLIKQLAPGIDILESATPLIDLLDEPIAVTPFGSTLTLQTLARNGITIDEFVAHTTNHSRQEQYRHVVQEQGLEKLARAKELATVLEIVELDALIPDEEIPLRASLQAVQNANADIGKIRACARLLWWMQSTLKSLPKEQRKQWRKQSKALRHISLLVYQVIGAEEADFYWKTYETIETTIEQALASATLPGNEHGLRQAVHSALQQVSAILESVRELEPLRPLLPPEERYQYRAVMDIRLINDQLLATDHEERQALLMREIGRLQILAKNQLVSWLTINREVTQVVEHDNPWHALTCRLIEHLEIIQQLDSQYVNLAAKELSSVLQQINSMKDVAELEERLGRLTISGDSLGLMIEETIQALIAIGHDVKAALAIPQSMYHHRQTLIDAQDKSNQLRNSLHTRYVNKEPRIWAESVQRISTILDNYLSEQGDQEQATYCNPYIVGNPIQPKNAALFKGRIDLALEIAEKLRGENRPTLVMYGPRRMGKTSFLLQLQNLLQGRGNYVPVFFNAQEPGARQGDAGFFYSLARAIYVQMRRQAFGRRIKPPDLADYENYAYTTINTWIEDEIAPLLDQRVLLVTIDEFEKLGSSIIAGELTERVLDFMRHMSQHSNTMLFLLCGGATLEALGPNAASYFISTHVIQISYLSEEAADELIRNPNPDVGEMPDYDDEVIAEILYLTHRQPFLIQAICSNIVDVVNNKDLKKVEMNTLDEVLPTILATYAFFFKNIWDDANEKGQHILAMLARSPARLSKKQTNSAAGQGLRQRHVIHLRTDGQYEIEIPLVRCWVVEQI